MYSFHLPAKHYENLLEPSRLLKFTQVYVNSELFGSKKCSIFLRVLPIIDTPLHVADPAYQTSVSIFYPIYLDKVVMLGYMIMAKNAASELLVSDRKTIVRRRVVANDKFERGFVSKQMLMLKSHNANLFIPAEKYEN